MAARLLSGLKALWWLRDSLSRGLRCITHIYAFFINEHLRVICCGEVLYFIITIFISSSSYFQTTFNAPAGNEPLALDMNAMGKGQVWINGQSIGRYWPGYKASGTCGACNYAGYFNEDKCQSNCGEASQRW